MFAFNLLSQPLPSLQTINQKLIEQGYPGIIKFNSKGIPSMNPDYRISVPPRFAWRWSSFSFGMVEFYCTYLPNNIEIVVKL